MNDTLEHDFHHIIESQSIYTVFQPIISLRDGSIYGYEALSRISIECTIKNIEQLFELSNQLKRMWDLEQLCRTKTLENAFANSNPQYNKKLFINVNPNVMNDSKFIQGFTNEYLSKYGITPENIIFEITEQCAIQDMPTFQHTVSHYKAQNYQIAIDDAGSGYSGLNLISDIKPHFIKLDMKLIRNIHADPLKYALVKCMVDLCRMSNIRLIAEGIEKIDELATLIELGVHYGQGYYIQKPQTQILDISKEVKKAIQSINYKKNHTIGNQVSNIFIQHLCAKSKQISPQATVLEVYDMFKNDINLDGITIVQAGQALGTITRNQILFQLSGRYGYSLNSAKPIATIMNKNFLSVDYKSSISLVSQLAMSRSLSNLYDFIVITKNRFFLGTVTVKDLLQKTTEIEIHNAKHQNPLSGLPGNQVIEQKLTTALNSFHPYTVLYLDLDNFKAYNDVYGFERGDQIIKLLADIITKHTPLSQFCGHIGGDDFVIIYDYHNIENTCNSIIQEFDEKIKQYYYKEDLLQGFITTINRHNQVESFPLISLSIAVVHNKNNTFSHIDDITKELAKAKKLCKQNSYSCYYIA